MSDKCRLGWAHAQEWTLRDRLTLYEPIPVYKSIGRWVHTHCQLKIVCFECTNVTMHYATKTAVVLSSSQSPVHEFYVLEWWLYRNQAVLGITVGGGGSELNRLYTIM